MNGATVFQMVSGLGDAFGGAYSDARKQAQEEEAPTLISNLMNAYKGGGAAVPATGLGAPAGGAVAPVAPSSTPAALPSFAGGGGAPMRVPGNGGEIETRFVDALKSGGLTNPYGLAAMAAYAGRESGYKPGNITGSWSDPSESGQPGTSGGILSWRGDRFANMRRLTAGAKDPVAAQATFALTESPELTLALQNAKSPEEANQLMARAWKFAGYNRPGGEFAARLGSTREYLARLGGAATEAPAQVASAEPDAANLPAASAKPAGFVVPQGGDAAAAPSQAFPGFPAGAATRMTPELQTALNAAWRNPSTRAMTGQIFGQLLKGQDAGWDLKEVNGQSAWVNTRNGQILPIGQAKRNTATVGNNLVDTATGEVLYAAPDKDSSKLLNVPAGTTVLDPVTRQPIYTAPRAERDEGDKVRDQVAAREQEAKRLGLEPGTPKFESYVLTSKIGRDQELSATDKKAIMEAEESVLSAQTAVDALNQAKAISPKAYVGPTAGIRGYATSLVGSEAGEATQEMENIVSSNALGQLKAIFGGNPTEGERKILLQIQGSASQPDAVRQKIFDRGIALAQRRLEFNQRRAEDLKGGTFYKAEGKDAPRASGLPPSLPVKVTPSMKPEDIVKRFPSGTRLILPDGSEGRVP
ncbi:hypothetical protein [Methylobacterium sp. R2-1]|uniref:hypothetical protein n=1 Tax=Methylobacterium sp. R2-1 TaxID=2587064 RepID=UPI0016120CAB|nr:hypothetical protein [Methylobacterium sp. R2-1]MBB2964069.1 hypothetical protein [Methylobacterium sp. R2-1]